MQQSHRTHRFKEIPTLKIGQDILGSAYVFDRKDNIVGIWCFENKILYLFRQYQYFWELYQRLLLTDITFEVYDNTSGRHHLRDLQSS